MAQLLLPSVAIFSSLVALNAGGIFSIGPLAANANYRTDNPDCLLVCDPDPGVPWGNDLTKVSSGYFPFAPAGKCSHGQLNKDNSTSARGAFLINGFPLHDFARGAAERYTGALFDQIKQALISQFGQQIGDDLWNFLVKDQRNIAFCIDDTGSMAGELPGIKTAIINKINEFELAEESPILSLFTFKDDVTFQGSTCIPTDFIPLIEALQAADGGDCPEASLTAVKLGIARVGNGGAVIVATDASPIEGGDLKSQAITLGQSKNVKVSIMLSGDCGEGVAPGGFSDNNDGGFGAGGGGLPAVETYREIAAKTGGLFFAVGSNFDQALEIIIDSTAPDMYDFALIEDVIAPPTEHILPVPIDSTVQQVDFLLNSLDGGNIALQLRRPDGTPVQTTDPDADFVTLPTIARIRITFPGPGTWEMVISGDAAYAATAAGASEIGLVDFLFFNEMGPPDRPFHEILNGSLLLNEPVEVQANLFGNVSGPTFELTTPDGTPIDVLALTEDSDGLFFGGYTPTALIDRFLVKVTGSDVAGHTFQRILRSSYTVSVLGVQAPDPQGASPGCDLTYTFEITNLGVPDTFAIAAGSANDFPVFVSNPLLTIGTGETLSVDATVSVPQGTGELFDDLAVVVTSITDPTVNSSAVVPTLIEGGFDCNCNGIPDEFDIADGTSEDCNGNGIPDECIENEVDCNGNSIPDECDIADGTSADCNGNGIPDECILNEADCNSNGVPDECDVPPIGSGSDCNSNGVPDECDVPPIGSGSDCNSNGVPDECDIAGGTSADCSGNGIPDECEPDCNGNGQADSCDILNETSPDTNLNCVPDECDCFSDPQQTSTHTDLDFDNFGFGDVEILFGIAEGEALAASYTITAAEFPLEIDLVEMVFAQSTSVPTETHWSMLVWEGTPDTGNLVGEISSDGVRTPHLNMPAGDVATILSVSPNPGTIIVNDIGTQTFSVGIRIDQHNDPGPAPPCFRNLPKDSNAFPAVDLTGVSTETGNWMYHLSCGPLNCPAGWLPYEDLGGCAGDGDSTLRVFWTPTAAADCNENGVPDYCEIADGTRLDTDGNGILDECECPWDLDGNGEVGAFDLGLLLGVWGLYGPCPPLRPEDFNQDYDVGAFDLGSLLGSWGPCPITAEWNGGERSAGIRIAMGAGGGCPMLEEALQLMGYSGTEEFIAWLVTAFPDQAYWAGQVLLLILTWLGC